MTRSGATKKKGPVPKREMAIRVFGQLAHPRNCGCEVLLALSIGTFSYSRYITFSLFSSSLARNFTERAGDHYYDIFMQGDLQRLECL